MLLWNSIDVVSKQILCLRHLVALGFQNKSCYSKIDPMFPPAPKKNKNAWLLYYTEIFPTLKKEFPDRKIPDLMIMAGERWRNSDPSLKEKYQMLAENDKMEYMKALQKYEAALSPELKAFMAKSELNDLKVKNKKQLELLGMPKRPPNAYVLFAMNYCAETLRTSSIFLIGPEIASAWAKLSKSERAPWYELATKKHLEYKEKLATWEGEMVSKGLLEVVHSAGKDEPSD